MANRSRHCIRGLSVAALCAALLGASPAWAEDQWSTVHPGIELLRRTTAGPQVIRAAVIDLTRPEISIRATRYDERGRTTSSFAQLVGAAVAINGDWFEGSTPLGLAVGRGELWPGSVDLWDHAFIACTIEKECTFDSWGVVQDLYWRWWNVVGGNHDILVEDGVTQVRTGSFYDTDRHPRSAVGLSADGHTMYLVVVQGRRTDSAGMTWNEMGALMADLGAHDAMMLDGGGSSTLVIDGARVNDLPSNESGERSVANHLAILRTESMDARCGDVSNGRFCLDGTRIASCEGGAEYSEGDCAVFGATCDDSLGIGYCVDYRCRNGGNEAFCLDGTRIGSCELGRYMGEGDCAAYGASCEESAGTGYCVHYLCVHGGNASWCLDGDVMATCTMGQYAETRCVDAGQACSDGLPGCVDSECVGREQGSWCEGDVRHLCADGVQSTVDCALEGLPCVDGSCGAGDLADAGVSDDADDRDEADGGDAGADPDGAVYEDLPTSSGGCTAAGGMRSSAALPWLLMLVVQRRRRKG